MIKIDGEFACDCIDEGSTSAKSVIPCGHYVQSTADRFSLWCILCGHVSTCHEQFALLMSGRA